MEKKEKMKTPEEIKKIAHKKYSVQGSGGGQYTEGLQEGRIVGFIDGYTQCQKDNSDNKYTEEQVRNLVDSVTEFISHNEPDEFNEWFEKKLLKLQQ